MNVSKCTTPNWPINQSPGCLDLRNVDTMYPVHSSGEPTCKSWWSPARPRPVWSPALQPAPMSTQYVPHPAPGPGDRVTTVTMVTVHHMLEKVTDGVHHYVGTWYCRSTDRKLMKLEHTCICLPVFCIRLSQDNYIWENISADHSIHVFADCTMQTSPVWISFQIHNTKF